MKIFNVVFGVLICMAPVGVHAATVEFECGYFNPAFGLCSTHSHNIGATDSTTNLPVNLTKSEEVAQMNNVIALKSTVIAQQLKEQYDALNAIIKRFKTQLEKAVLTSKIEVLTGNAASGNSGGGSSSSAVTTGGAIIAGASDCQTYSGSSNIGSCLMTNSQIIVNTANSDTASAKKQLANDLYVADMYGLCNVNTDAPQCCSQVNVAKEASDKAKAITQKVNGLNKNQIISCAQTMRARVSTALEDKQQNTRNNRYNRDDY